MNIKKKKDTFNDYDVELSWGQLEVILGCLERDHSDPVADEMYAELQWYMDRLPGPGESDEDIKAREEAAAGQEEEPLAMPPHEGSVEPPDQEGETPYERFTGREEPQGEAPPPDTGLEAPPGVEGDMDISPEEVMADTPPAAPPPKQFMSTPPPTLDSKKTEKPEKLITETHRAVCAYLEAEGLEKGRDFWIKEDQLMVDPEMSDAVVTLIAESSKLPAPRYNPANGTVTFTGKPAPKQELVEAPPEN